MTGDRTKRRRRPSPRGVGRDGTRARDPGGSVEAELAPRPRGVGRGGTCARGQRGRASRVLGQRPRSQTSRGPRPGDCGWFALPFAIFIILIWVSFLWYPTFIIFFQTKSRSYLSISIESVTLTMFSSSSESAKSIFSYSF